jgi:hypothetical protein
MQFLPYIHGLGWFVLSLALLLFLQRALHHQLQALFLLITRREELSLILFSLLFLPGVFAHELSHFLTARVLSVRTGQFSLIPRETAEGRIQMGFVETEKTGLFRDALIGAAPLVTGISFVAYAGLNRLDVLTYWEVVAAGGRSTLWSSLGEFYTQPDFWVWFYLAFVVSSTMFPSAADRRAWLPVLLIILGVAGVSLLAGAGDWIQENLLPLLNRGFQGLALILAVSLGVHAVILLPVWALVRLISWITGLRVV